MLRNCASFWGWVNHPLLHRKVVALVPHNGEPGGRILEQHVNFGEWFVNVSWSVGEWMVNGERMSFRPLLQECDITNQDCFKFEGKKRLGAGLGNSAKEVLFHPLLTTLVWNWHRCTLAPIVALKPPFGDLQDIIFGEILRILWEQKIYFI